MKKEDVVKLVNAGFTKEEILGLLGEGTSEKTPDKTPEKTPDKTPEKTPEVSPLMGDYQAMTEGISTAIIEAIQKNNILNSSQKEEPTLSGEDILANVLDLLDE